MPNSKRSVSSGCAALLAAIVEQPDHEGAAAFVAAIRGERNYKPSAPRGKKSRFRSRPSISPGCAAFLAAITEQPDHEGAAAFAAAILCEHNFNPNEPRDEKGRWTTGGSHEDWVNAVMRGGPAVLGTSGSSRAAHDAWLNAITGRGPGTSGGIFDDEPNWDRPARPSDRVNLPYQEKPGDFDSRIQLCMAPPEASPAPSPGLGDIVIATPDGKDATKPTTTEWFDKYIWGPLQNNGGTSASKDLLEKIFFAGCVGLTTLTTAGQFKPFDPEGKLPDITLPDVRVGFQSLDEALKYQDKLNKDNPLKQEGTTISGQAPKWRIFALLYSSKNENPAHPTAEPVKRDDGSYDYSNNGMLLTIAERSKPGATNFDFFTRSEPGDPWYNADRPWIHADQGGKRMSLEATDTKGIEEEAAHNHSDFGKPVYFVARERQYPKPR